MQVGDIQFINGEKWVCALDKSSKRNKMFEWWNCKTGARMASFVVKEFPTDKESIKIIERMANCEISFQR